MVCSNSTAWKLGALVFVTALHLSCSLPQRGSGGHGLGPLPPEIVAAIALCSGGYTESIQVSLRVEFENRSGAFITSREVEERGADVFAFGELRGAHAVELYNTYVRCVQQERERAAAAQDAQGVVSIATVTRVFTSSAADIAFDVVLRNTMASPIVVTEARFDFDEHLTGVLASVLEVSNTYVVSVEASGALVESSVGTQPVLAWYPSPDGEHLIVIAPLSQKVPANGVDRFRLIFSGSGLRGPLERVTVALTYNGDQVVRSGEVRLAS